MKKVLMILMVFALLVVAGCNSYDYSVTSDDADVKGEVNGNQQHIEITTEEGTTDIDLTVENEDSWCMEGTNWQGTSDQGNSNMLIEGIMSSGEFEGFCHIVMNTDAGNGNTQIDYYMNEGNTEGYYVMTIDGQEYKTSWSG